MVLISVSPLLLGPLGYRDERIIMNFKEHILTSD